MDAFFASVELLRYPELREMPVVVGGRLQPVVQADGSRHFARLRDYVGRGVITTATYEARALGVHSGMGLMKAAALAPNAILLPPDFAAYRHYSRMFKAAVAEFTPLIEDRGIDEIYLDLSHLPGAQGAGPADPHAGVRALARAIKARVRAATGLTCSLDITPNKLLSKLCSDLEKPDGLTILTPADIPARIWPLPVRRINGIGPKAGAKLESLGIRSIGQLAASDPLWLMAQFGSNYGNWLHHAAHGRDESPLVYAREPRTMSRETTFEQDLHPRQDRAMLGDIFSKLCQQVAADLNSKGYLARTVGVKLKYADFRCVTRELTLTAATDHPAVIRGWAGRCLTRAPLEQKIRLLGVRVGALSKAHDSHPSGENGASSASEMKRTLPLFP